MSGQLVAIVVACVLLVAASVAGVIGGSPWYLLFGVVGVPLLVVLAYQRSRR
jgi:Flp pilus assembly protein TadB